MTKVALMTVVGAILAGMAVSALIAVVPRSRSRDTASTAVTESAAEAAPRSQARPRRDALSTRSVPPSATHSVTPSMTPSIAEGRTELGEGMFAERAGAQVTVHFDTDDLRTRFDEKFERIVRSTLPRVFGPDVRAALNDVPVGNFVRGGDLLRELPTRGIALQMTEGRTLTVWPITRPGRDGPLVDSYRAAITH
ncbi:MAG TPA: hypothetical protein VIF32_13310 [Gemmatimonadaceae bacterium]